MEAYLCRKLAEVTLGGAAVDTRTHNALNEIETRDPGDDPSYDLGGNTVSVPVDADS